MKTIEHNKQSSLCKQCLSKHDLFVIYLFCFFNKMKSQKNPILSEQFGYHTVFKKYFWLCGIYTLDQLSKLYVIMRLEESIADITFSHWLHLMIRSSIFLIHKLSLSCLLLSSHLGLWPIMVTFSLPKISWWPVDLRCLLIGRSGLQLASLLLPFKCLLSCYLVSPTYWKPQIAYSRR